MNGASGNRKHHVRAGGHASAYNAIVVEVLGLSRWAINIVVVWLFLAVIMWVAFKSVRGDWILILWLLIVGVVYTVGSWIMARWTR